MLQCSPRALTLGLTGLSQRVADYVAAGGQFNPEWISNLDPLFIVIFQIVVSLTVARMGRFPGMITGIVLAGITEMPPLIERALLAWDRPVTALIGYDLEFYEHLGRLFPHADARSWFVGNEPAIRHNAFMNASLQAGYFIVAARALGFDCGPMSGFDSARADAAFFAGTQVKSFVLVNLGHGDPARVYPRGPRFEFGDVCAVV